METLRSIFGYAENDDSITDAELEIERNEWVLTLLQPMQWRRPVLKEVH